MPISHGNLRYKYFLIFAATFSCSIVSFAQSVKEPARRFTGEPNTARSLELNRKNPLALRAFLVAMPKGGDLHNHLSGAVYAESWIREAAESKLCIDGTKLSFLKPHSDRVAGMSCGEGSVPASDALRDQNLYDAVIDAFSMRGFVPSAGNTGHDHFFDTFNHFGGDAIDPAHMGEWLDEVATRAAAQNEQYLELMHTGDFSHTAAIAREVVWKYDFGELRTDLLNYGLRDDVNLFRSNLDQADALRRQREHCGQKVEAPACHVEIRYLYQILRGFPKEQVFAQILLGFEIASTDPRVIGINFVMPEDGYISMEDYTLHMRIIGFLRTFYPNVHISLHAGELAPGLVTPEGLCCHIHQAVEYAHAERIGHGVDVMYEDHPYDLLRKMAALHVMVEINLTSNDLILGVSGKNHPFPLYRKFSVPVALSTDDEGVSRIDITHEYVRAVEAYGLRYADLKEMVRTSLEHSFLPGSSLWKDRDIFSRTTPDCAGGVLGDEHPPARCAAFLQSSEKASQQWELERRFRVFESTYH